MKFSEYLTEGAIEISSSMKDYAEKALKQLLEYIKTTYSFYDFDIEFNKKGLYKGKIESKYGDHEVITIIDSKNAKTFADSKRDYIWLGIDNKDYFEMKHGDVKRIEKMRLTILHELVHIVDPKSKAGNLERQKEQITKFNKSRLNIIKEIDKEKDEDKIKELQQQLKDIFKEYYKFPWEIDAYMSTGAESRIKNIKTLSRNKKEAYNWIRNLIPETPSEEVYFSDEFLKKRYQKLLYKLIDKEFE